MKSSMGNTASDSSASSKDSSSSSNDQNSNAAMEVDAEPNAFQGSGRNSQSATIVIIGHPIAECIANTDAGNFWKTGNKNEIPHPNAQPVTEGGAFVWGNGKNGFPFGCSPSFGSGGGGPFGPSGGSGVQPDSVPSSFQLDAIGGLDEQIKYLKRSIILPLARPEVLREWGVFPPKGILLHGPPGTGKTFMAKALVNELKKQLKKDVKFFYRKGGDVFSMWFGESQRKLREVFEAAKSMSPSVIFFDEIDGLCPSREGKNHGTEAYNSVVTCFLGQMDLLENGKVFVIAATNRLDAVDAAVRRPGRFDKHLAFGFPDENARRKIIEIHTGSWSSRDKPNNDLVVKVASKTMGFSGADLEKLCKDVVYTAMEENGGKITDAMVIKENHWLKAMSSMQRTAVDSYGSSVFIPTKPPQIISLLIEPLVNDIVSKIRPLISEVSLAESSSTFMKSFALSIIPNQSKSFLNGQILQGILSDQIFSKCSMFELSTSKITNKVLNLQSPTVFGAIYNVINQACEASMENPTILVVPNLNELLALCKANQVPESTILQTLAKVRGPRMLLLATSSIPLSEIPEKGITELFFDRFTQVENPTFDYLHKFFNTAMIPMKKQIQCNKSLDKILDNAALQAAKLCDNVNYESILSLWSAMEEVQLGGDTNAKFQEVFKKFEKSDLR